MKTTLQLATIFALIAVVGIPAAFASGSQVSIDTVGDAVIDLNASEHDRTVRVYAQFTGFDSSEKSFMMKVVNPYGDEVFSSMIYVTSTSSGLINFNSHVMYLVTDDAIQSSSIASGNYEMQITDNDGNVLAFIPLQII